ncbi:MAG TPA: hypothetical protein VFZ25_09380, partial [Chloroflexota bacterium]|nr:hypothetical protein [Chloroflexota bacterium]
MSRFPRMSLLLAVLLALSACGPGVSAASSRNSPGATPAGAPTTNAAASTTLQPLPTATPVPSTATPVPPTATPRPPTPTPTPAVATTWFNNTTIVGFYGRAFGVAPVLGRLGEYQNIDEMAKAMDDYATEIQAVNGGKKIIPEIHLIYAMAIPCEGESDCLFYEEA